MKCGGELEIEYISEDRRTVFARRLIGSVDLTGAQNPTLGGLAIKPIVSASGALPDGRSCDDVFAFELCRSDFRKVLTAGSYVSLVPSANFCKRPITCCRCGGAAVEAFGDRAGGVDLMCWTSTVCDHCGAIEADDRGPLPPELRDVLIAEFGSFAVLVNTPEPLPALVRLRDVLGLDLRTVNKLKNAMPGPFLGGSTRSEANRVRNALAGIARVLILPEAGHQGASPDEAVAALEPRR